MGTQEEAKETDHSPHETRFLLVDTAAMSSQKA